MSLSFILSDLDKIFSRFEIRESQTQILLQQNKNALNHKKIVRGHALRRRGVQIAKTKKNYHNPNLFFFFFFVCLLDIQTNPKEKGKKRKKEKKKFLQS
jgi:hypothetical protein